MRIRRLLVAIVIAALIGTGMPAPREAQAVDTAVIVVTSIVAWFGIVVLATYLIRSHDSAFGQSSASPSLVDVAGQQQYALKPVEPAKVRFGASCARTPDGPSLLCW
jgi:hypothetical protein